MAGRLRESRFIVLCHARSGSTLLLNSLREHPALHVYGELFQDEEEHRSEGFGPSDEVYVDGTDGVGYLEDTIFRFRDDPELLAIGFKLMYQQARDPATRDIWPYLIDQSDLRVVHLTRDSALHAFISMCEAETSGRWTVEIYEELPPVPPIRIDPERCLEFLDGLYAYRAWARHAFRGHQVFELSYERLLTDFSAALHDVQAFLEIPPMPLPPLLRRQGTRPLAERVTNLSEITALVERTIHAPRWRAS
jgi:LPS sulfotransferase NodH